MCTSLFKKPKIEEPTMPTKSETISDEDAITVANEEQKKRRGYSTTIATSGSGVTDPAITKKTQLGT